MALIARLMLCALALLALALPVSADAKSACGPTRAPSGNPEIDQYAESLPGPCGQTQTGGGGGAGAGSGVVPAGTAKQLQAKGAAGQAALATANGTAPDAQGPPPSNSSDTSAPSSDEGMGLLLPLLLGGTLLAGIVYLLRRRRAGLAS